MIYIFSIIFFYAIPLLQNEDPICRVQNKAVCKDHVVSNFIDDKIKLTQVLYYKQNE